MPISRPSGVEFETPDGPVGVIPGGVLDPCSGKVIRRRIKKTGFDAAAAGRLSPVLQDMENRAQRVKKRFTRPPKTA